MTNTDPPGSTTSASGIRIPPRRLIEPLREPFHETRWLLIGTVLVGWAKNFLPLTIPWSVGHIIDDVLVQSDPSVSYSHLAWYIGISALAVLATAVTTYFRFSWAQRVAAMVQHSLRQRLFHHIQRLSMEFFQRHHAGALGARVSSDINSAGTLFDKGIIQYGMDGTFFLVMSVLLLTVEWRLTLVAYGVLLVNALIINHFKPILRQQQKLVKEGQSLITGKAAEIFASISLVKACNGEDEAGEAFIERSARVQHLQYRTSRMHGAFNAVSNGLIHVSTLAVLTVGAWMIISHPGPGAMTKGTLVAFLLYLAQVTGCVQRMIDNMLLLQEGFAGLERIVEVLGILPTPSDRVDAVAPPLSGRIEFTNVSFRYGDKPVIQDFDFVFEHGKTYALVGPSGSGKSTLCQLMLRFYDPASGRIVVDGHDLQGIKQAHWRANTAVVLQDPVMFSTTVADNIGFAVLNRTQDDIVDAAKRAQAHDFIEELPDGYATRLGERGVNLSGGQRQRVAIARALMRDPKLMILDEATSALDTVTERAIQTVIDELRRTRTVVIIAHRLSTIRSVDEILVLDHGRLVEHGSYDDLIARGGLFARLAADQDRAA
jgi:ABC-type multidrug transport system fused ATPase/permease subunit